jgi:hypothetical protein
VNDLNYFSKNLINIHVVFHACKKAFTNLLWPLCGIGVPIVYFAVDGLLQKFLLFIGVSLVVFIPYVTACFIFHRLSLKTEEAKIKFCRLSPKERGVSIGDELSGWW